MTVVSASFPVKHLETLDVLLPLALRPALVNMSPRTVKVFDFLLVALHHTRDTYPTVRFKKQELLTTLHWARGGGALQGIKQAIHELTTVPVAPLNVPILTDVISDKTSYTVTFNTELTSIFFGMDSAVAHFPLQEVLLLTRKYTLNLYHLLLPHDAPHSVTGTVAEFKRWLGATTDSYNDYLVKKRIVQPAVDELANTLDGRDVIFTQGTDKMHYTVSVTVLDKLYKFHNLFQD